MYIRTDLALECRELHPQDVVGVHSKEEEREDLHISTVRIESTQGAQALGKPKGTYITMELPQAEARFGSCFDKAAHVLAGCLRPLLPPKGTEVFVIGLGNTGITPDGLGPRTVERILKTRHLVRKLPGQFGDLRPVAAIEPGVLGTTGVETAELVRAVTEKFRPACILAVDALAARRLTRICRSVQIADSGICPGSGVGNARAALNKAFLGVPVVAVGVPTVVDAAAVAEEFAGQAGLDSSGVEAFSKTEGAGMIVTPKDIDNDIAEISKLLAYGINLALHDGLTMDDIDAFLD